METWCVACCAIQEKRHRIKMEALDGGSSIFVHLTRYMVLNFLRRILFVCHFQIADISFEVNFATFEIFYDGYSGLYIRNLLWKY